MKGGKTILAESAATAADGAVSFDNLMTIADNKQEYTIKEVEVPAGYLPNMNPYELPIDVILRPSFYLLRH